MAKQTASDCCSGIKLSLTASVRSNSQNHCRSVAGENILFSACIWPLHSKILQVNCRHLKKIHALLNFAWCPKQILHAHFALGSSLLNIDAQNHCVDQLESNLVWKWPLCEWCFVQCYTIYSVQWSFTNKLTDNNCNCVFAISKEGASETGDIFIYIHLHTT